MFGAGRTAGFSKPFAGGAAYANAKSLKLDGSNEYLTLGAVSALDLGRQNNPITLGCWVKQSASGSDGTLICRASSGSRQYQLYLSSGVPSAYAGGNFLASASSIDTAWHHIVLRIMSESGTWRGRLFVDGADVGNNTSGTTAATGMDVLVGARRDSSNSDYAFLSNAYIDEVAFFAAGLSTTEITEWYNAGATMDLATHSQAANLVTWLRMETALSPADTNTTIYDRKGSNNATGVNLESGDLDTTHTA